MSSLENSTSTHTLLQNSYLSVSDFTQHLKTIVAQHAQISNIIYPQFHGRLVNWPHIISWNIYHLHNKNLEALTITFLSHKETCVIQFPVPTMSSHSRHSSSTLYWLLVHTAHHFGLTRQISQGAFTFFPIFTWNHPHHTSDTWKTFSSTLSNIRTNVIQFFYPIYLITFSTFQGVKLFEKLVYVCSSWSHSFCSFIMKPYLV